MTSSNIVFILPYKPTYTLRLLERQ